MQKISLNKDTKKIEIHSPKTNKNNLDKQKQEEND